MAKNNDFEAKLQRMIDSVLSQRQLWEKRRSEAEEQIKALDSRLAAYQATLKDYWESINKKVEAIPKADSALAIMLEGKTIGDCCYFLARESGKVKVGEVAKLLLRAGKLKSSSYHSAYSHIHTELRKDNRFYKVGGGKFALKDFKKE